MWQHASFSRYSAFLCAPLGSALNISSCRSCPRNREFLHKSGLSPYELDSALRAEMNTGERPIANARNLHDVKTNLHYHELSQRLCALASRGTGGVSAALSLSAILGDVVTRFGDAAGPTGGYPWSCGGEGAITKCVAT